jgi:DNA repair protein RadC
MQHSKIINFIVVVIFTITVFVLQNNTVLAVDKYTLLEPLPCVSGVGNCTEGTMQTEISFQDYVGYVFKFSIALAVFLAIVVIIYAGFEYMLSEALPAKLDAKGRIKKAITGLLLVFASYLILRIIDPRLVQIYTEIPPVNFKVSEEVRQFQNNLTRDLQKLSTETQKKVLVINERMIINQSRLDELNAKKGKGTSLSDEELLEIKSLEQSINTDKSNIIKESAKEIGYKTISDINIIATTESNQDTNFRQLNQESKNKVLELKTAMELAYSNYAKELRDLGDLESSQKISKQLQFYNSQIDEEQRLMGILMYSKNYLAPKDREKLLSDQEIYLNIYRNPEKFVPSDPDLQEVYKKIAIDRVNKIKDFFINYKPPA